MDILFQICDHFHHTGRIMYSDFQEIAPETYMKQVIAHIQECVFCVVTLFLYQVTRRLTEIKAVSKPEDRGVGVQILESLYRYI